MDFKALIQKKRDGFALTKEEIEFFAFSAANETVPDYQLSAMLMAIFFNSLNEDETLWLTDAMARSGDMADLSAIDGIKVDKHSTGGVGDKTTLIVAPVVASCGVKMAKMSGRVSVIRAALSISLNRYRASGLHFQARSSPIS